VSDKISYIVEIINWRNAKNIYFWSHARSPSLFWAMSDIDQRIYVITDFFDLDLMEKAITLAHEIQHLIQRHNSFVYSPLLLYEYPEIAQFANTYNQGISFESGKFY
jgi:hypothetical protein